ncbi:hypothetical protein L596_002234 [Steinernema carpocapsae]|uniref:Uncharacterized protein n=1 Tax=Steinernema carpocapsae TaxID=34508 RepID=A0A4U8URA8_STECR|nr:hypothetical protein L596_002234 [Steinernema carpocapsae]
MSPFPMSHVALFRRLYKCYPRFSACSACPYVANTFTAPSPTGTNAKRIVLVLLQMIVSVYSTRRWARNAHTEQTSRHKRFDLCQQPREGGGDGRSAPKATWYVRRRQAGKSCRVSRLEAEEGAISGAGRGIRVKDRAVRL